jgi:hypothetical protein
VPVEALQNQQCINLMKDFIRTNPDLLNEDIGEQ